MNVGAPPAAPTSPGATPTGRAPGAAAGATQSIASGPAARAATGASDPNWHANGGNDACVSSAPSPTTATETVMPPTSHPAAGATPAARVDGTTSSVAAPSSAVHASPPSVTSRSWNAPPPPPAASGDSHAASADDTNAAGDAASTPPKAHSTAPVWPAASCSGKSTPTTRTTARASLVTVAGCVARARAVGAKANVTPSNDADRISAICEARARTPTTPGGVAGTRHAQTLGAPAKGAVVVAASAPYAAFPDALAAATRAPKAHAASTTPPPASVSTSPSTTTTRRTPPAEGPRVGNAAASAGATTMSTTPFPSATSRSSSRLATETKRPAPGAAAGETHSASASLTARPTTGRTAPNTHASASPTAPANDAPWTSSDAPPDSATRFGYDAYTTGRSTRAIVAAVSDHAPRESSRLIRTAAPADGSATAGDSQSTSAELTAMTSTRASALSPNAHARAASRGMCAPETRTTVPPPLAAARGVTENTAAGTSNAKSTSSRRGEDATSLAVCPSRGSTSATPSVTNAGAARGATHETVAAFPTRVAGTTASPKRHSAATPSARLATSTVTSVPPPAETAAGTGTPASGSGRYANRKVDSATPAPTCVAPTGIRPTASSEPGTADAGETHVRANPSARPATGKTAPNEHATWWDGMSANASVTRLPPPRGPCAGVTPTNRGSAS